MPVNYVTQLAQEVLGKNEESDFKTKIQGILKEIINRKTKEFFNDPFEKHQDQVLAELLCEVLSQEGFVWSAETKTDIAELFSTNTQKVGRLRRVYIDNRKLFNQVLEGQITCRQAYDKMRMETMEDEGLEEKEPELVNIFVDEEVSWLFSEEGIICNNCIFSDYVSFEGDYDRFSEREKKLQDDYVVCRLEPDYEMPDIHNMAIREQFPIMDRHSHCGKGMWLVTKNTDDNSYSEELLGLADAVKLFANKEKIIKRR